MSSNQNLHIIVIDDNPEIHKDFIKILMKYKSNDNETDSEIQDLEQSIFGSDATEDVFSQFEIDTATQGKEGVEMIANAIKAGKPYSLAFVDIRMPPGWDGIETIKHIWEVDPNIQVVICTAYSDYTWEETVEQLGQKDNLLVLKKPFDNVSVRQLACALTKKWELLQDSKLYTLSLEERINQRTKSLNQSLSLMRATLESSADGVLVVVNKNDEISDYNNKLINMWNFPKSLIDQKKFSLLLEYVINLSSNPDEILANIKRVQQNPRDIIKGNIHLKDKRIFEYYAQPYTVENNIIGRVWSFRDVSLQASLQKDLEYQATHDLLTGLPNRVMLRNELLKSIATYDLTKNKFGILFLDLDRFKLINDSISHQAGDLILRAVSERLQSVLRKEDILCRLGGDEFIIVINNVKNDTMLFEVATKLLASFESAFPIDGREITLSTSIGICTYPNDGKNVDLLLRNADIAMYHAKELGANQYQFYTDELNRKNKERLTQEIELRHAILNNEFMLYYQPQLDLKTEKLVSVEALIRWNHPIKGIVMPLDFIPLAEETGLIVPIGEWVLKTACQQIKEWHDKGFDKIRVAVNITTKQIKIYNLVKIISDILNEIGLDPKYLELELTETMIINNNDIINTIRDLKKLGIQIVLDDFGTGYSSLNYLRQLPIDRLKIDQSYVQNIESDRSDAVIIQAIMAMAKSMNLEVLAEGVESKKQLDFLKSLKCGEVQGFYFSKPLSASDCEKVLNESESASSTYL